MHHLRYVVLGRNAGDFALISFLQDDNSETDEANAMPPISRLPRRSSQQTSVAELVKRYQEYLPPSVSTELAATALAPQIAPTGDSDTEATDASKHIRPKLKHKHRMLSKQESISDFEHSFAANVAPKYLTRKRPPGLPSRIPGPYSAAASHGSSRRTSPDKRPSTNRQDSDVTLRGRSSPPLSKQIAFSTQARANKTRIASRTNPKEKLQSSRAPSSFNIKGATRKTSSVNVTGGKVSNIARHFERIHKDSEKANRRYTVIRGRRARPVASSRATVEVFDSVKDAIKDVSDVSDSSSEADDEGEDDDEGEQLITVAEDNFSPPTDPEVKERDFATEQETPVKAPIVNEQRAGSTVGDASTTVSIPDPKGDPKIQSTLQLVQTPLATPPASDIEVGPSTLERPSTLMKALTGFWPHQIRGHFDLEADDLLADPEHIFRESSMVVRTDEPTSIIALALKYVGIKPTS